MSEFHLYPDPGKLPDKPEPKAGSSFIIKLSGYPPYKEKRFSIRNPKHRHYERFVLLRRSAISAMKSRKWYDGPIEMNLTLYAPEFEKNKSLNAYVGGIMDTLDGSHGQYFTYLPVVYQDDCQITHGRHRFIESTEPSYELKIVFLEYKEIKETCFTYESPYQTEKI
jgi:hypothetical protein